MTERLSRRKLLMLTGGAILGLTGRPVSGSEGDEKLTIGSVFQPDPDGKYRIGIPGIVVDKGELPSRSPLITERPNWPKEVLLKSIRQGPADRPLIGLTVDDAFLARGEVLDALVSKNVKATFFMIGRIAASDPGFIKRALDLGYEFGNHTFSHGDLTRMTPDQMRVDIKRGQEAMLAVDARAQTAPFLRPPGGARNSATDLAGADMGFRSINWNVSGDTGATYTSDQLVRLYLNDQIDKMKNPWGSILLIHFNARTASGLLGIIDGLRVRNLEPVSLSKLFEGDRI
ncbi:MAG: polysaccharide deacetylase family protein [Candidatus Curtissbacteria bacterium]|nr:polysaccharide deacetylase family protein [Candidatus Curtissbacteria bacterium]